MSKPSQTDGQTAARRDALRAIVRSMVQPNSMVWQINEADLQHFGAPGLSRHKVVCETALLLVIANPHLRQDETLLAAIQNFVAQALECTIDARMLSDLDRYPQTASSIALLLLAARCYDVPCDDAEHIERAFHSPFFLSAERVPFRIQEARWLQEKVLPTSQPWHAETHDALFDRWHHPAVLSRDDLYAITHSTMYLSDFGRRQPAHTHNRRRQCINLRHAMAMSLVNADWDLLGELALSARYLRLPQSGVESTAEAVLWSIYDRHGFVPGLGYRHDDATKHEGAAHQFYQFLQSYHSTLVLALLACAPAYSTTDSGRPAAPIDPLSALCAARRDAIIDPIAANVATGWYSDEIDLDLDMLLDGIAICQFRAEGRVSALKLLKAIPDCHHLELLADTLPFLAPPQAIPGMSVRQEAAE